MDGADKQQDQARTNGGGAMFDDFTVLPGVGSAIDRRLHDAGVRFYRDLADLDAQRLAELLAGIPSLSSEKISNADWVGRAAELARAATGSDEDGDIGDTGPGGTATSGYESFVLRVATRSGRHPLVHVQQVRSGEERHLAGLDGLGALIVELVGGGDPEDRSADPADRSPNRAVPSASLLLQPERRVLREYAPFAVTLTLTFADPAALPDGARYVAAVRVRAVGGGRSRSPIATAAGRIDPTGTVVSLAASGLPAGRYRVDATMEVADPGTDGSEPVAVAFSEYLLSVVG